MLLMTSRRTTTLAISNVAMMLVAFQLHSIMIHDSRDGGLGVVHAFPSPAHPSPRRRPPPPLRQRCSYDECERRSPQLLPSHVQLHMGLYDTPLPPRPDNNNNNNNNKDDENNNDDDEEEDETISPPIIITQVRLFQMEKDGSEKRNFLPPLNRRLDIPGLDKPYYEETDRKVQNLVQKTQNNCHPLDVCWSLEAHRGNVREAWESIKVAQRTLLNEQLLVLGQEEEEEEDWDTAWKNQMTKQQNQNQAPQEPQNEQPRNNVRDLWNDGGGGGDGTPDQPYLPKNSFGPEGLDSDEPWYTG